MKLTQRLISFRNYKEMKPDTVAKEIGLSVESYIDLEMGKIDVNDSIIQKLSALYQVPPEFFVDDDLTCKLSAEVLYNNCTFISNQGICSGYINHQYNDRGIDEILFAKNQEIKELKQRIEALMQDD